MHPSLRIYSYSYFNYLPESVAIDCFLSILHVMALVLVETVFLVYAIYFDLLPVKVSWVSILEAVVMISVSHCDGVNISCLVLNK